MVQAATAATAAQGAMEVTPAQTTTESASTALLVGMPADVYDEKHEWED